MTNDMMTKQWMINIREQFDEEIMKWDEKSLKKYSTDYSHFSPVLVEQLKDKYAECIVSPRDEEELEQIITFAVKNEVPVTVRGNGTGNYGQCVPMTGGIVLNLANMNKILEVGDGYMVVQPGVRMGKMEQEARKHDQEMRLLPSTYLTASIGGYIAGGSGGIGSISHGFIWDGMVRSMKVKTMEENPRTIEIEGEELRSYLHTYGTIGIVSELVINIVPKVEWAQLVVTFSDWVEAAKFAQTVAEDESIQKRLVSCHEAELAKYFKPLNITSGRAITLLEVNEQHLDQLQLHIDEWNGLIEMKIAADSYHKGISISDFSWNHTTLWTLKGDPSVTYLQMIHQTDDFLETTKTLKEEFPEYMVHLEFVKSQGKVSLNGLPVFKYVDEERLNRMMARSEELGSPVVNPHTWKVEDLSIDGESILWRIKHNHDPKLLLNQLKLIEPSA